MILSTKRDQYWSFWYQGWSNHQVQELPWWNEVVEVIEAAEVVRPGNSLLRTLGSSRLLNLALVLCFEKTFFRVESWNIILYFCIIFVSGCWGHSMSFFWKLVDETQIPKPPEATRNHNSINWLIFLPLRADLLLSVHSDTPCMMTDWSLS